VTINSATIWRFDAGERGPSTPSPQQLTITPPFFEAAQKAALNLLEHMFEHMFEKGGG